MAARASQTHHYYHQAENLSWWSLRGIQRHTYDQSRLCGKNGSPIRFLSYQAYKSLKICLLATMERQRNDYTTDLQKFDLQKLQHAVTNFCKSVKCLYISVLSAKNVKMSKMSVVLKSYTCTCAHTRVYTHTSCARKLLTFWHFDIFRVYFIDFQCVNRLAKIAFLIFHFCKS